VDNIQRGSRKQNSLHHYMTSYLKYDETQSFSNESNDGARLYRLWCPTQEDIRCIAGLLDMCHNFSSDIDSSALAPVSDYCIIIRSSASSLKLSKRKSSATILSYRPVKCYIQALRTLRGPISPRRYMQETNQ
jgi:hypothetical protein